MLVVATFVYKNIGSANTRHGFRQVRSLLASSLSSIDTENRRDENPCLLIPSSGEERSRGYQPVLAEQIKNSPRTNSPSMTRFPKDGGTFCVVAFPKMGAWLLLTFLHVCMQSVSIRTICSRMATCLEGRVVGQAEKHRMVPSHRKQRAQAPRECSNRRALLQLEGRSGCRPMFMSGMRQRTGIQAVPGGQ